MLVLPARSGRCDFDFCLFARLQNNSLDLIESVTWSLRRSIVELGRARAFMRREIPQYATVEGRAVLGPGLAVIVDPGGRGIGVTEPLLDLGDVAGFDTWPNPLERFVADSALEEAGFEPLVPRETDYTSAGASPHSGTC